VIRQAVSEGCNRLAVATAAADLEKIQFYRTLGFRIENIEPDIFTAARGYPEAERNGIPVRDRVWLKMEIGYVSGQ
jgi:lactoylglutathione lyase